MASDGSALKQTKLLENDKELITKDELGSWLSLSSNILLIEPNIRTVENHKKQKFTGRPRKN